MVVLEHLLYTPGFFIELVILSVSSEGNEKFSHMDESKKNCHVQRERILCLCLRVSLIRFNPSNIQMTFTDLASGGVWNSDSVRAWI